MLQKHPQKLLSSALIIVLAPLLALGLYYFTHLGGTNFLASVLNIEEQQLIEEKGWGIAYKVSPDIFEIFGSSELQQYQQLQFELLYNADTVTLGGGDFPFYHANILAQETGYVLISLLDFQNRSLDQERFAIPFTGELDQIILGEAYALDTKQQQVPLAVGNLHLLDHPLLSH